MGIYKNDDVVKYVQNHKKLTAVWEIIGEVYNCCEYGSPQILQYLLQNYVTEDFINLDNNYQNSYFNLCLTCIKNKNVDCLRIIHLQRATGLN